MSDILLKLLTLTQYSKRFNYLTIMAFKISTSYIVLIKLNIMLTVLIERVKIVSPDITIDSGYVIVIDGIISSVSEGTFTGERKFDSVVDGMGAYLMPGFIDIHSHGALGYGVMDGVEALDIISKYKLKEGVTTFLPSSVTASREDIEKMFRAVAEYIDSTEKSNIIGVHMEGPFFNRECSGAQNPNYITDVDVDWITHLNSIAPVKIVSLSVEESGALDAIGRLTDMGIVCSQAHSKALSRDVRLATERGLRHLTHFCNVMTPLHHRDIGAVGQGLINDLLKLELICDKIHLCPEMIELIFKVKSIDNIMLVTDAVKATGVADGKYDMEGVDIFVEDGIVRTANGNLAGSTLRYNHALRNVVEVTGLPLDQLIKTTSLNQAESLGLSKLGRVEEGYWANLVMLDDNFNLLKSWIKGENC